VTSIDARSFCKAEYSCVPRSGRGERSGEGQCGGGAGPPGSCYEHSRSRRRTASESVVPIASLPVVTKTDATRSRGPRVTVMQPTDARKRDELSCSRRFDVACDRRVAAKRHMRSIVILALLLDVLREKRASRAASRSSMWFVSHCVVAFFVG
jgi:hypothetical protein